MHGRLQGRRLWLPCTAKKEEEEEKEEEEHEEKEEEGAPTMHCKQREGERTLPLQTVTLHGSLSASLAASTVIAATPLPPP